MNVVTTEAIVLRSYNLAEADRIVLCFTRDAGLIRGVAKGARRMIFTGYYGIEWLVRAYLIWKSTFLPKFLGVLMGIGGLAFVLRNFLMILAPQYASDVFLMLMFPGALAMTVWLFVKGVDVAKWNAKLSAAHA